MKFRLIKLLIWILVIIGLIFNRNYNKVTNYELESTKTITVESGDVLKTILNREFGFNKTMLSIYLKNNPVNFSLQKGDYKIIAGSSLDEIISTFETGPAKLDDKVRIIEGRNIFDIDNYLTQKGLIKSGAFIKEAKNVSAYKNDYSFLSSALTLEGFLYPDTYFINPNNFTPSVLIKKQLDVFESKIYTPLLKNKTTKEIVEIVNLASILEKEANHFTIDEEKTIAGILKKRYEDNWMIGADITACYAYELTENECKMSVSKYIAEKNAYNTRTKTGLPKTPILNPRINSIKAVLNPINTEYWFYLHDANGNVHYAKTNTEHNINRGK